MIDPATGLDDDPDALARPSFAAAPPAAAAPPVAPPPGVAPYVPQQLPAPTDPGRLVLPPGAARVEQHVLSPAGRATLGAIDANTGAQMQSAQQEGALGVQRSTLQAQQADQEAAARAAYDQHRVGVLDAADKEIASARAHHQQETDRYRQMGLKDYWSDKTTGQKILAAVAVFLGGLGTRNGGPNTALQIINNTVEQDMARQRAAIEKQRDAVSDAKGAIGEAVDSKSMALRDLDIRKAAALDNIAGTIRTQMAKLGVPQAQIDANQGVQQIEAKALQTHQGVDEKDRTLVVAKAGKALTGGGMGGAATGDAISKLSAMAQQGATSAALTKEAYRLGLRDDAKHPTHVVDLVAKLQKDPEKQAALEVRDTQGNVIGTAGNSRAAQKAAEQLSAADAYKTAITALRDHVARYGHIYNPYSDEAKERQALLGDYLARGRKALDLGVSKSNMDIEHQIASGSGVGFDRSPSLKVLDQLAGEVDKIARTRVNTTLRQGQPTTDERVPASPSPVARPPSPAPRTDEDNRMVAKALQRISKNPKDETARAVLHELGYKGY